MSKLLLPLSKAALILPTDRGLEMPHLKLPFEPLLGITSPYWQTVLGSYGLPLLIPDAQPLLIDLPDGDQLFCYESTPKGWTIQDSAVVLAHGMAGSSDSNYILRFARALYLLGYKVVCLNFRSCGPGMGRARKPSHGGRSDDLLAVCNRLRERFPSLKLTIVGFSLSGNILLKMLGELGSEAIPWVDSAYAICPPVDLKASSLYIHRHHGRGFEKLFIGWLREKVEEKERIYQDYPKIAFPKEMTMYDFDDFYTAPLSGFKNAEDYYTQSSSNRVISQIAVPTKILYALDDPIVPASTLNQLDLPPEVSAYAAPHGGHLGFLSWTGKKFGVRWMDKIVMDWLME